VPGASSFAWSDKIHTVISLQQGKGCEVKTDEEIKEQK
jgi:hypothetical protein